MGCEARARSNGWAQRGHAVQEGVRHMGGRVSRRAAIQWAFVGGGRGPPGDTPQGGRAGGPSTQKEAPGIARRAGARRPSGWGECLPLQHSLKGLDITQAPFVHQAPPQRPSNGRATECAGGGGGIHAGALQRGAAAVSRSTGQAGASWGAGCPKRPARALANAQGGVLFAASKKARLPKPPQRGTVQQGWGAGGANWPAAARLSGGAQRGAKAPGRRPRGVGMLGVQMRGGGAREARGL
ncbi:MAG: hypothetical protein J3K34DRAFT_174604 [Monoraphidium minutum]|nr:MAG: hypothetical protein J3K34DRAFT_174604 [Monoraphidium minutum]